MFNTFFSPTAESIPVSGSGLGSLNVLDALKKLAFTLTEVVLKDEIFDNLSFIF